QIFAEVCANCHRGARELKNGASASFLREHYTTSSDMASTMAAYLAGVRSDPRGASPSPKSNGASTNTNAAREPAPPDNARDRRRQRAADPKAAPPTQPAPKGTRPTTARADAAKPTTAGETKPPAAVPPLEEFEE